MPEVRLNVQSLRRASAADDESLGRLLVSLVEGTVERSGAAPSVAVAVGRDRVDLVPLVPLVRERVDVRGFVAGLTRSELAGAGPIEAVGLMGSFEWRSRGQARGAPLALVFLEWTDCRWWHWRALFDAEHEGLVAGTGTVTSASDGCPKPDALGGWWSLGRRRNLKLKLERVPGEPPGPVVH
jgi:hypothetical protein